MWWIKKPGCHENTYRRTYRFHADECLVSVFTLLTFSDIRLTIGSFVAFPSPVTATPFVHSWKKGRMKGYSVEWRSSSISGFLAKGAKRGKNWMKEEGQLCRGANRQQHMSCLWKRMRWWEWVSSWGWLDLAWDGGLRWSSDIWERLGGEMLILHVLSSWLEWVRWLVRMSLLHISEVGCWACPVKRTPWGRPRTCWRDYISQLWRCSPKGAWRDGRWG